LSELAGGTALDASAFCAALAARGERGVVVTCGAGGEGDAAVAPGHLRLLEELGRAGGPSTCRISDLPDLTTERAVIPIRASSAQVSRAELAEGVPYPQWDDPTNKVHVVLWRLMRLAIGAVQEAPGNAQARRLLDEALDSRSLRAASGRPWWDCCAVQEGARRLLSAVAALGSHGPEGAHARAQTAYREILCAAEEWEYTGEARHRRARYLAGLANAGEAPPLDQRA
ncbi:MAG: hypothetical protein NTZ05_06880, partial [Chloroflexi bacterium]|nr:hypothetical protein [Chloroflexota bacterium]